MSAIGMTWPQYRRGACSVDGVEVYLTPYETELLSVLLIRRGTVVAKTEIYELLWPDPDTAPEPKIVDVYVCRLRKKMSGVIETSFGRGYVIEVSNDASSDDLRAAA